MYSGKYSYIVDNKGRIFVPVKFRKGTSPKSDGTFVVTKGFDKCLWVFPNEEWRKAEEKFRDYPINKTDSRRMVRWVTANAEVAKLDSQGRIKIPQHLLDFIEVGKEVVTPRSGVTISKDYRPREVVIIGVLSRLEIWEPKAYNEEEKKSEPAGFEALSELTL